MENREDVSKLLGVVLIIIGLVLIFGVSLTTSWCTTVPGILCIGYGIIALTSKRSRPQRPSYMDYHDKERFD
jgi:uncharacterized membrane protein HdeD (DUF308 family)